METNSKVVKVAGIIAASVVIQCHLTNWMQIRLAGYFRRQDCGEFNVYVSWWVCLYHCCEELKLCASRGAKIQEVFKGRHWETYTGKGWAGLQCTCKLHFHCDCKIKTTIDLYSREMMKKRIETCSQRIYQRGSVIEKNRILSVFCGSRF